MKKVLIGIIVLLVCILCVIFVFYKKKITFKIPSFDENATVIPEKIDNEYYTNLDVTDGLSIGVSGVISVDSNNEGSVNLTSSVDNKAYVKARLLDSSNNIVGETGLIKPGEYVEKMKINKNINEKDKFTLKIMSYDPNTYYSMAAVKLSVSLRKMKNEK